ncbi:Lipid phosphate phosphatase 2 [Theobroma cacao]|uniref:Lipid phosphate phosphatase 2 n=1 Tax=Theobroma cacao TaxID=3641 RepID=A0A061FVM6_THECC|nr:Lipid phosphate phosphatase 2 [Theobroma cacao]
MSEILLGAHTLTSHGVKVARIHLYDWLILVFLVVIDGLLNFIEPFHRFVGEEMMTDLKFPFHKDTIPFWAVPFLAVLLPLVIFSIYYYFRKDVYDFHHAVLGLLFSVLVTGVITDSVKDAVGRPRPNFFWRCFPDGKAVFDRIIGDVVCHGNEKYIKEGYKSFPSGHTSWSFAGLSFLSWYMSGKIRVFDRRGHVAKLCVVFLPVLVAALVGVSRVDDYWHHWTDVFAGALIGSTMAAFCYLQFFPSPHNDEGFGFKSNIGWAPHAYFQMLADRHAAQSSGTRAISPHGRKHQTHIEILPMVSGSGSVDSSPDIEAMTPWKKTLI